MSAFSPKTDLSDLKRKSVRGGMITFISQGMSIVIQLASTVILARLLTPDDYGIITMVAAATALAGLLRDMGLSTAAIQKKNLTNAQQTNLFWINVAMGLTLTVGLGAASPLVARFYHKPEVLWVTVALSTSFLIGSLAAQSGALLVRNMWFGRQATATLSGALTGLVVAVALALNGFRYWALVWGQLAGAMITTCFMFFLSPFRPGLPCYTTGVKEMLKFGAHITAFDFVNYFQRNLDSILIGRVWGAAPLGLYSRAYALLMFPVTNLRAPINAVAFPVMSRLQNQPEEFRAYYLRVTSLLALLSMPLTAFLFVASKPVIELLLGQQWLPVTPIFSWLALAAFIQPTAGFAGSLLLSRGQGRRYLAVGTINAVLASVSFLIGVHWGAKGVAMAYSIASFLGTYPYLSLAFRGSPIRFTMVLKACAFPVAVSLSGMTGCAIVTVWIGAFSPWQKVACLAGAFALGAGIPLVFTKPGHLVVRQIKNLLR